MLVQDLKIWFSIITAQMYGRGQVYQVPVHVYYIGTSLLEVALTYVAN